MNACLSDLFGSLTCGGDGGAIFYDYDSVNDAYASSLITSSHLDAYGDDDADAYRLTFSPGFPLIYYSSSSLMYA